MFAFNGAPTRIRAPNMAGSPAPRSTLGIKAGGNANTLPINSPWVCVSTPKPEPCESFCRAMGEISVAEIAPWSCASLHRRRWCPLCAFPAITALGKGLDAYVAVDASGTFSETKRQAGLLRMLQAGVILSDYATLIVEILKDNARPEAGEVYGAVDMGWAKLVGQIAQAYEK